MAMLLLFHITADRYGCNGGGGGWHCRRMTSPFLARDASFQDVLGEDPQLVKVADAPAHEGPAYVAEENALYVTSTPDRRHESAILRLPLADNGLALRPPIHTVVAGTDGANGMTLGLDGSLFACI